MRYNLYKSLLFMFLNDEKVMRFKKLINFNKRLFKDNFTTLKNQV